MELEIGLPDAPAGRTDNIHDTVNYGEVVTRITAELATHKFRLREALAEHVCRLVLDGFPNAQSVKVSVAKLGHVRNVRKLGLTLERRRPSR